MSLPPSYEPAIRPPCSPFSNELCKATLSQGNPLQNTEGHSPGLKDTVKYDFDLAALMLSLVLCKEKKSSNVLSAAT